MSLLPLPRSMITTPTYEAARKRLDAAMADRGLYLVGSYVDGENGAEFEVREYGDALDGRAFTIDLTTGRIEETDR